MNVILILIIVVIIILVVVFLMQSFHSVRLPKQSIIAFTGTLGSGKTYLAVKYAIKSYKNQKLKHSIYSLFVWLPFRDRIFKSWKWPASIYSNIPIRIGKDKISTPLQRDDLLNRGRLPEKCVILIDEFGQIASQWEFDNPLVMEQFSSFIRFFRHWLDGRMFVTDQVVDNIVKPVRSRLGMIYNLHDFRRFMGLSPFYKVTAIPLVLIEDETNAVSSTVEYQDVYFFGWLGFVRSEKNKNYESRCYKPIYTSTALRTIDHFDETLYTRYLIDISVSREIQKDYRVNRDKYKSYLYDVAPVLACSEPPDNDVENELGDLLNEDINLPKIEL